MERLGALEAKVMEALWRREGEWVTVGDTVDDLSVMYRPRQWAYNSVMTVMGRLADKGYLLRRRQGRAHTYRPVVDKEHWPEYEASLTASDLLDVYGQAAATGIAASLRDRPELAAVLRRALDEEG